MAFTSIPYSNVSRIHVLTQWTAMSPDQQKKVSWFFMQCIAAILFSLNMLEIMHLSYKEIKKAVLDFYPHFREG